MIRMPAPRPSRRPSVFVLVAAVALAACGRPPDTARPDPCERVPEGPPTPEATIRVNDAGKIVVTPAVVRARKGSGSVDWVAGDHPVALFFEDGPRPGAAAASGDDEGGDAAESDDAASAPSPSGVPDRPPLERRAVAIGAGERVTTRVNPEAECGRYKYGVAVFDGEEEGEGASQAGPGRGAPPTVVDPPFYIVP